MNTFKDMSDAAVQSHTHLMRYYLERDTEKSDYLLKRLLVDLSRAWRDLRDIMTHSRVRRNSLRKLRAGKRELKRRSKR